MTFKEFLDMCQEKHMHMVLWDFWHIEWKWLCKHDYHNWQLHNVAEWITTEENEEPYIKITRNKSVDKLIARCHCCGREVVIVDGVLE